MNKAENERAFVQVTLQNKNISFVLHLGKTKPNNKTNPRFGIVPILFCFGFFFLETLSEICGII